MAESQPAATAFRVVSAVAFPGVFQPGHWTQIVRSGAKPAFQFDAAISVTGPAINALIASALSCPLWLPDFIHAMRRLLGLARGNKNFTHIFQKGGSPSFVHSARFLLRFGVTARPVFGLAVPSA
jgi:hypothetical protein